MTKAIYRHASEPQRNGLSWAETWQGADSGLIKCWETGRALASKNPDLAESCKAGELPPLNWKGGVARALKKKDKFGALQYLAQWQGLRGVDLDVVPDEEVMLVCSKTAMQVTFTSDTSKLANQQTDEEGDSNERSTSGISEQPLFS